MGNKEHIEALTTLLEFQVIAGERDREALRAAIRALEAEDNRQPVTGWDEARERVYASELVRDFGLKVSVGTPTDFLVAQHWAYHQSATVAMEDRYRALVEAAKKTRSVLTHSTQGGLGVGPLMNEPGFDAYNSLCAALDALEK